MSILIFHWRKLKLKLFKLNFEDFFNTEKMQISVTTLFRTFPGSMNKENTVTLKITPRKIYNKNPDQRLCRLCGKEFRRFSKIFSKPGKSKCLQHQVFLTTGINILETDNLSGIEQEHSTNVQNDCIKPTKKSLKFMEHSSSDISNQRDNTIIIDIRPFTTINMNSTVSFVNEKFVSVQHFPLSKPSLTTPNPELVSNIKNVMDESSVPPR